MPRCHVSTRAHQATKAAHDAIEKGGLPGPAAVLPSPPQALFPSVPRKKACDTMTDRPLLSDPVKTAMLGATKPIKFNRFGGTTKQQQEGK
jgi:hypothetical protein